VKNIGTGNDDNLRDEIRSGKVTVPDFVSPNATELLKGLLEKNVKHRLSAPEVKSHKFFLGVDWGKVERREYEPPFLPCRRRPGSASANEVLGISNFGRDQRDAAYKWSIATEPTSTGLRGQHTGGFRSLRAAPAQPSPSRRALVHRAVARARCEQFRD